MERTQSRTSNAFVYDEDFDGNFTNMSEDTYIDLIVDSAEDAVDKVQMMSPIYGLLAILAAFLILSCCRWFYLCIKTEAQSLRRDHRPPTLQQYSRTVASSSPENGNQSISTSRQNSQTFRFPPESNHGSDTTPKRPWPRRPFSMRSRPLEPSTSHRLDCLDAANQPTSKSDEMPLVGAVGGSPEIADGISNEGAEIIEPWKSVRYNKDDISDDLIVPSRFTPDSEILDGQERTIDDSTPRLPDKTSADRDGTPHPCKLNRMRYIHPDIPRVLIGPTPELEILPIPNAPSDIAAPFTEGVVRRTKSGGPFQRSDSQRRSHPVIPDTTTDSDDLPLEEYTRISHEFAEDISNEGVEIFERQKSVRYTKQDVSDHLTAQRHLTMHSKNLVGYDKSIDSSPPLRGETSSGRVGTPHPSKPQRSRYVHPHAPGMSIGPRTPTPESEDLPVLDAFHSENLAGHDKTIDDSTQPRPDENSRERVGTPHPCKPQKSRYIHPDIPGVWIGPRTPTPELDIPVPHASSDTAVPFTEGVVKGISDTDSVRSIESSPEVVKRQNLAQRHLTHSQHLAGHDKSTDSSTLPLPDEISSERVGTPHPCKLHRTRYIHPDIPGVWIGPRTPSPELDLPVPDASHSEKLTGNDKAIDSAQPLPDEISGERVGTSHPCKLHRTRYIHPDIPGVWIGPRTPSPELDLPVPDASHSEKLTGNDKAIDSAQPLPDEISGERVGTPHPCKLHKSRYVHPDTPGVEMGPRAPTPVLDLPVPDAAHSENLAVHDKTIDDSTQHLAGEISGKRVGTPHPCKLHKSRYVNPDIPGVEMGRRAPTPELEDLPVPDAPADNALPFTEGVVRRKSSTDSAHSNKSSPEDVKRRSATDSAYSNESSPEDGKRPTATDSAHSNESSPEDFKRPSSASKGA